MKTYLETILIAVLGAFLSFWLYDAINAKATRLTASK